MDENVIKQFENHNKYRRKCDTSGKLLIRIKREFECKITNGFTKIVSPEFKIKFSQSLASEHNSQSVHSDDAGEQVYGKQYVTFS